MKLVDMHVYDLELYKTFKSKSCFISTFLDMKQKDKQQQRGKLDIIKILNFVFKKTPRIKWKDNPWPKIGESSSNHLCDKGLVSRIYKEQLQLYDKKKNDPM